MPHKSTTSAVSGRPPSAGRPKIHNGYGSLQKSCDTDGAVSYEDLIIAQYMDELKKTPPYTKKKMGDIEVSPYEQRLAHTDIVPTPQQVRAAMVASGRPSSGKKTKRPQSATVSTSSRSEKQKLDAYLTADVYLLEQHSSKTNGVVKHRHRPMSAPAKRIRPSSAYSKSSVQARRRRFQPLYAQQPHTIVTTAFKNGSRENFVKVAAPNIKQLLEMCTDKLGLNSAARRAFLEDGSEIFTPQDIPRDAEIYVSQGEPFKSPYEHVKQHNALKKTAAWTVNGLSLPTDSKRGVTKALLSKRFVRSCIEKGKRRVLVYRNGVGGDGGYEIVADLDKPQEFLNACTSRLEMRSHAKVLYDWEGNEIYDLNDTPVMDACIQLGGTPVLGPLWLSKGEGFSPKGPREFLSSLMTQVKTHIQEQNNYKQQLEFGKNENEKYKVEIVAILSMNEKEISEALKMVEKEIQEWKNAFNRLKQQLEKIDQKANDEEDQGASYTMKNIKELQADDRLVGHLGIKLKIYENGSYDGEELVYFNITATSREVGGDRVRIMHRLLDHCSARIRKVNAPALSAVARKLYDKTGQPVTDPFKLVDNQELWLSYGEAFQQSFVLCLQVEFDKATGYNFNNEKNVGIREQLLKEDIEDPGRDRPSSWEANIGFPISYDFKSTDNDIEKERVKYLLEHSEISVNATYLQYKDKEDFLLYPDLIVSTKKKRGSNDVWPADSQLWLFSKKGYIYCKSMPQLILSVSDMKVETKLSSKFHTEVQGYGVSVQKKMVGNPHQQWGFTPDGFVYSMAYPELVLTHLGNIAENEESQVKNEIEGILSGHVFYAAVCNKMQGKDVRFQRWALKQERLDNLGQWKHCDVQNLDWNKLALSWPVKQDGSWNESYDWPMEGFLTCGAPTIKKKEDLKKGSIPLRLNVVKNGEKHMYSMTPVVGPDLTNMMKDVNKTSLNGKRRHTTPHRSPVHKRSKSSEKVVAVSPRPRDDTKDSVDDDPTLHCHQFTLQQLEFTLFLERCTALLNLPFAARRLFDENGREHFTLNNLQRDQVVYASCGETWIDPRLTRTEQQRRLLLAKLAQDVAQMRQYCALRDPQNYVLEVEGALMSGANLLINQCCLSHQDQELLVPTEDNANSPSTVYSQDSTAAQNKSTVEQYLKDKNSSAHERAHTKSEQRLDNLKWPWERLLNDDINIDTEDDEHQLSPHHHPHQQAISSLKPKVSPRHPGLHLQKFRFSDGFICLASNPSLVVGVSEQEGRAADVILVKKKTDDISQRWIFIKDDSTIQSRFNSQFVMSVSMPSEAPADDENIQISYTGCRVSLQHRKGSRFGKANQRWHIEPDTGFLRAFYASEEDKEITAANKANVCTYAVRHNDELDQPGYIVKMQSTGGSTGRSTGSKQEEEIIVCTACARAMRGRQKLQKLSTNIDFTCAMGTAKDKGLKQVGSFQCLNGKVDLSTYEAENTLQEWESQLVTLREETSVRAIANQISAANTVKPVKVYAYKNGEGRLKPGHHIVGSSIVGILDQCTHCLGLTNAARRLYTLDGQIILDMDDLVNWAVGNYRQLLEDHHKKELARSHKSTHQSDDLGVSPSKLESGNNESQETSSSGPKEVHELMENMQLNGAQSQAGSNQSSVNGGQKVTSTGGYGGTGQKTTTEKIILPPTDVIMRYPIEVWASCGEQFIQCEVAEERYLSQIQNREQRKKIMYELEKHKHVLRQMQGRRLDELNPGKYRGNRDPTNPVLIEGNWQEPTEQEQIKHDAVHRLQTQLSSVKQSQKTIKMPPRAMSVDTARRLYEQPNMKRVLVFPNGESVDKAVYVWGQSIEQIMESCRERLSLVRTGRRLFDMTGHEIDNFDEIERDMMLCVSTGKNFLKPKDGVVNIEIKANWGRARKEYGNRATDIMVAPSHNPNVDVDPFGPPELASGGVEDAVTGRSERSETIT